MQVEEWDVEDAPTNVAPPAFVRPQPRAKGGAFLTGLLVGAGLTGVISLVVVGVIAGVAVALVQASVQGAPNVGSVTTVLPQAPVPAAAPSVALAPPLEAPRVAAPVRAATPRPAPVVATPAPAPVAPEAVVESVVAAPPETLVDLTDSAMESEPVATPAPVVRGPAKPAVAAKKPAPAKAASRATPASVVKAATPAPEPARVVRANREELLELALAAKRKTAPAAASAPAPAPATVWDAPAPEVKDIVAADEKWFPVDETELVPATDGAASSGDLSELFGD